MRRKMILCTSAAIMAIAAPALAQSASGDGSGTVQEVVITGFRASLQSALNAKRLNDLPIESVAPEDIGKMPDQNVAESLQRLPGVQIDRTQGQGTSVLIDGLRQNAITLNGDTFLTGKEFYVSGEASGGGLGATAQYDSLEGIPSEEIGRIDVYKNPNASITEGGLGGTIDLRTRDPLNAPLGLSYGGNLRGTTAEGTSGWTPNGTLVATWKASPTFAITGSVSYDDEKTLTKEFEAYNRSQWDITNLTGGSATHAPGPGDYVTIATPYIQPQLAYVSNINDERKILGGTLGVSAKLSDGLKTSLNWFYSHENDVSTTFSDKIWFNGAGEGAPPFHGGLDSTQPYAIASNGVVQSGTFYAPGAETATLYQHGISEANNVQWRTNWDNGGPLKLDLDLSYSHATSNYQAAQADIEHGLYNAFVGGATSPGAPGCNNGSYTCAGSGNPEYQFTYSNGGTSGLPSLHYLTNVLSNASDTTFKSNWAWANKASQDKFAIRFDGSYNVPNLEDYGARVTAGFRYEDRKVQENFGRYLLNDGGVSNCCQDPNGGNYIYYLDPGYVSIPYSNAATNSKLGLLVNNFAVGPMLVKNPGVGGMTNPATFLQTVWNNASVNAAGTNNTEKLFVDPLSSFKVDDTTTAGYVMFDMGRPQNHFHINFGVRFVQTDLKINNAQPAPNATYYGTASWNGVDSNPILTTARRSYTDVLPSVNVVFDPAESQKVRFSVARVVSPQDLFSLGVGGNYGFTRETGLRCNIHDTPSSGPGCTKDGFAFDGGTSGNAKLDPYRATQGLISYENYFAKGAVVSVEGFWKQIDNFVEIQNIPTTIMDDFGGTTSNVSEPVNAGKGQIYGFEFSGQYNFGEGMLPQLKGFGIAGNYTISESTSDQATAFSAHSTIPGVAKNAFTVTGFYERWGFSARLSYSWRDKAVNDGVGGSTFAFPNLHGVSTVYQVFSAPYGQLDGQIGYDINKHLGVVFSVQNISEEAQHTYLQWPNQPFTYDNWGRRFFLGVKFKG